MVRPHVRRAADPAALNDWMHGPGWPRQQAGARAAAHALAPSLVHASETALSDDSQSANGFPKRASSLSKSATVKV